MVGKGVRIMFRISRSEPVVESGVSIVRGSLGSDAHGENSCGACDLFLVSSAALLTHHMHRRNYVNPFRKLVSSSVCHSCGLDFHTLKRAFTHVAYASKKCSQYYVDFVPPMLPGFKAFWGGFFSFSLKCFF